MSGRRASRRLLPAPAPYRGAVVAFTAHTVVAADVPPEEVRARLPADDLGAPMAAPFLAWLGHQLGLRPGLVDVVLVHLGMTRSGVPLVPARRGAGHPAWHGRSTSGSTSRSTRTPRSGAW